MDFFQNTTFKLNYEWSSDEDEVKLNPAVPTSRFASVSSVELDELEKTENEANTVRQTVWAVHCFQTGLRVKSITFDLQFIEKAELNEVLRQFYGSVRTTRAELYGINSYLGRHAGLNRYIDEPPVMPVMEPKTQSSHKLIMCSRQWSRRLAWPLLQHRQRLVCSLCHL